MEIRPSHEHELRKQPVGEPFRFIIVAKYPQGHLSGVVSTRSTAFPTPTLDGFFWGGGGVARCTEERGVALEHSQHSTRGYLSRTEAKP